MSTNIDSKIKKLLQSSVSGTVCLASWLEEIGISRDLQKRYKKSGWLESIGTGAFIRSGDKVEWSGAIYSIQDQLKLSIHPAALTSIALQGRAHYVRMGKEALYLFAPPRTILPKWFKNYDWGKDITFSRSSFLPCSVGFTKYDLPGFSINISSLERAMLECLYLAPEKIDLVECYQIMEGLTTLRPKLLQELLEKCTSVKVTRLFLYLAEKADHAWYPHLNLQNFDLGHGDRSIVKGGVYIAKYKITVPKELSEL